MKKLILISFLTLSSSLFAAPDLGIRIQTPIGNGGVLDIGFKSDDHRYDDRYRNFDYQRSSYADNYGYYYGYFDRYGYFYNNIYFNYDSRYTYHDRLNHRGYFKPNVVHYRTYEYHKNNDWNRNHQYREQKRPIYGPYYEKNSDRRNVVENHDRNDRNDRKYKDNSSKQDNKPRNNNDRYKEEINNKNHHENNKHNR